MKILGPTRFHRLNEAGGLVFLFTGFFIILCLISYHAQDPSWNSVTGAAHAHNLIGLAGSYTADLCFLARAGLRLRSLRPDPTRTAYPPERSTTHP